ncbi:MAG: hypothetical protein ABIP51_15975 [Bacteroidia bacterium]
MSRTKRKVLRLVKKDTGASKCRYGNLGIEEIEMDDTAAKFNQDAKGHYQKK